MKEEGRKGGRKAVFSFQRFSERAERIASTPYAFAGAVLMILIWAVTGPIFGFSDTWHLWINTPTTIVTFLLGFLILASGIRNTKAIHLKLDELIRCNKDSPNTLIAIEEADEKTLDEAKSQMRPPQD